MGPQQGQVVDLQLQGVFEFRAVRLPGTGAPPEEWNALAGVLSAMSAEGYAVQLERPDYLIVGKQVAVRKLSVDVGRVILPFAAPASAVRQ